jgi:hypothetical protein
MNNKSELQSALERIQQLETQLQQSQQPIKPTPPPKQIGFLEPLAHLWQFRFFIASWVYRDLISRSVRSQHGLFWMIFTPLAMTGIYVVAFSSIMVDHKVISLAKVAISDSGLFL